MVEQKTKAHLAVLSANLIFGINFSVVKYVTPGLIQPFGLNVIRVLVTTSLLWLVLLFDKYRKPLQRKDIPLFFACGLTGVAINQLLFIKGLSMTYSIHAALLMLCTPLLITVTAFLFLKERISLLTIAGLAIGISGATLLISTKENSGTGTNVLLGDVFIALNAMSYAIYFVLVKPLMNRYSPLQILTWAFTFGSMIIIPIGWNQFTEAPWTSFSLTDYAAIAVIVLLATFLGYLLNIYALNHLPASATGSYIYLQPIFATGVSVLFLQEHISWIKILSAALIFIGVFMVQRSRLLAKR
jgi:drug/metabolite transporter (DMT)-like permease